MRTIQIKLSTAIALIALLIILVGADASLLAHSLHQSNDLNAMAARETTDFASTGQSLPVIQGVNRVTGENWRLLPEHSPPFVLLVFRESCGYCQINWKNWVDLFGSKDFHHTVVFVSSDKKLSDAYVVKHPLLSERRVILSVDPAMLASLKLAATPQTVLVENGRVAHNWAGVLDTEDSKEIRKAVSDIE